MLLGMDLRIFGSNKLHFVNNLNQRHILVYMKEVIQYIEANMSKQLDYL